MLSTASLNKILVFAFCILTMGRLSATETPPELIKTFERYSRAWTQADWGRILDLTSPILQQSMTKEFGGREGWIKNQSAKFKDTITEMVHHEMFKVSSNAITFAITTKGKRPSGETFAVNGWATFELIDGKWYLGESIPPAAARPTGPQ